MQEYVAWLEEGKVVSEDLYAQQYWLIRRLKNHVPDEIFHQATVDQQVNAMDADFSFSDWLEEDMQNRTDEVKGLKAEVEKLQGELGGQALDHDDI